MNRSRRSKTFVLNMLNKQQEIRKPLPTLPSIKMEMSVIKWAQKEYTLKDFVQKFETSFPAIIKITEGYLGKQEVDSISSSTILRVHSLFTQKRAIATSTSGKIFSLPTKLKTLQFFVGSPILPKERFAQVPLFLDELLSTNTLPLTIMSSTALSFKEKKSSRSNGHSIDVLTVSEIYEENFLLGHPIEKANIQVDTPIVIPMYMKDIRLVLAEGYLNDNSEKWTNLCKHYDRKVQSEGLLEHFMVEEIFLLDKKDVSRQGNTYDEIDRIYIDIHSSEFQRQLEKLGMDSIPDPIPDPIPEPHAPRPVRENKKIQTLSEIPGDLHALDMQEVCDCLQLLNMGEYMEAFQREQIDGQFLFDLKKDIMISCLGMNELHVVKLLRFREGWRPK